MPSPDPAGPDADLRFETLIRSRSATDVADLLQLVPHLSVSTAVSSLAAFTANVVRLDVQRALTRTLDTAALHVLGVVVCAARDLDGGDTSFEAIEQVLPEGTTLADVAPWIDVLERRCLLFRRPGGFRVPAGARTALGYVASLGPSLIEVTDPTEAAIVADVAESIRRAVADAGHADMLPEAPVGRTTGRRPTKPQVVADLVAMLSSADIVGVLVADAPPGAASLIRGLVTISPAIAVDAYAWHHMRRYGVMSRAGNADEQWLAARGLLWLHQERGVMPREVGLALSGGRPFDTLPLDPPPVAVTSGVEGGPVTVDQATVDAEAAATARASIDLLLTVIASWTDNPIDGLKSGGVGVRSVRALAASWERDDLDVALLLELAWAVGLAGGREFRVGTGRAIRWVWRTEPGPGFGEWSAADLAEQWPALVAAWLATDHSPGLALRQPLAGSPRPIFRFEGTTGAATLRRDVLAALARLEDGEVTDTDAMVLALSYGAPYRWEHGDHDRHDVVEAVLAEARLLGVMAGGRLSSFGAEMLTGGSDARRRAGAALAALSPAVTSSFVVQADATVVVVGALDRDDTVMLSALADVESSGGATTYRITESSLRRALDSGHTGEEILAFLTDHAPKGVPSSVSYLVTDVARRHGHLRIGTAVSVVVADDPGVLADAVAHRRSRKLGLRIVAPTVAVSALEPKAVLAGLRDAGFLPVLDESELRIERKLSAADRRHEELAARREAFLNRYAGEPEAPRVEGLPLRFPSRTGDRPGWAPSRTEAETIAKGLGLVDRPTPSAAKKAPAKKAPAKKAPAKKAARKKGTGS